MSACDPGQIEITAREREKPSHAFWQYIMHRMEMAVFIHIYSLKFRALQSLLLLSSRPPFFCGSLVSFPLSPGPLRVLRA